MIQGRDDQRELLLAAVAGDDDALARLVRDWTPPIYRFCLRMCCDPQEARDLTQEVLLRAIRNLHRYDPERPFTAYVFGIARNACIDEHRRRRRLGGPPAVEPVDPGPSPAQRTERAARARRLHEAIAKLPPLYREVIVLYHFEHLKYREIAAALDLPIGTVMNRIFRARRKLRSLYGNP